MVYLKTNRAVRWRVWLWSTEMMICDIRCLRRPLSLLHDTTREQNVFSFNLYFQRRACCRGGNIMPDECRVAHATCNVIKNDKQICICIRKVVCLTRARAWVPININSSGVSNLFQCNYCEMVRLKIADDKRKIALRKSKKKSSRFSSLQQWVLAWVIGHITNQTHNGQSKKHSFSRGITQTL